MRHVMYVCCFLCLVVVSCAKTESLKVGVSSAEINPSIGSFIAGDKQNRKFTGVHDSLYAKAVVISHGDSHIALVTVDCIGLMYPDVIRIRTKAAELSGFPAERIVVTSTHTHAGPDVVGIWGSDMAHSGVDSVYMDFLVNTTAKQIQKAFENRKIATGYTAETTFGDPWVKNICNEELDRSLTLLHFKDQQQENIVTLANFACHPTFVDALASEVSADFIHGYYQTMKTNLGGEAMYLQGAIGGWVQPEGEPQTFENAFKRGKELADKVHRTLKQAEALPVDEITFKSKKFGLLVGNEGWKQLSAMGTIKRAISDSVHTEIDYFTIGKAKFITHPGETAPIYALESKKGMGKGPNFVLGLGNDALGYILKPAYFDDKTLPHAEYLTSMSVGKQTGPDILKHINGLIANKK